MPFSSFSKDVLSIFKDGIEKPLKLSGSLMFVDIKSFTSLVEEAQFRGEEKFEELLDRIERVFTLAHDAVEEEGGEIAFIAGDAMLVYFKNDLTQKKAKRAAHMMHLLLKERSLKVKGGITMGDFYIIPVDFPERRDFIFYGIALNEAASLEKRARPGEFLTKGAYISTKYPSYSRKLTALQKNSLYNRKVAAYKKAGFRGEWRNITCMFLKFYGDEKDFFTFIGELQEHFYPYITAYKIYLDSILMIDKGNHLFFTAGAPETTRYRIKSALDLALMLKDAYQNKLSIGIANGRAVSGFIGSKRFKRFTTLGESVNIAARLMEHAIRGEILFSTDTRYFENAYLFKFHGNVKVRGRRRALWTYVLKGKNPARLAFRVFVNRKDEINKIKTFVSLHRRGLILIEGVAGIGKTVLLEKVLKEIKSYEIFKCSAQEYAVKGSYGCLKGLVRMFYEKNRLPGNIQDFVEKFIKGEFVDVKAIETTFPAIFEALIRNKSHDKPIILAIDDWHLVDEASRKVIKKLFRRKGEILFVITGRKFDDQVVNLARESGMLLKLEPFTEDAIGKLISTVLGGRAHSLLIRLMKEKTSGNPLVLRHTLAYLLANEMLKVRNGLWIHRGAVKIPKGMHDIFILSFDELPEREQEDVKHLSVFGYSVPAGLFNKYKKYVGLPSGLPEKAISSGILRLDGENIVFEQQTYREAIYESMLKHERKNIHKKIAEFLEKHQEQIEEPLYNIAKHYTKADLKEKAFNYIDLALSDRAYKNDFYRRIELLEMKLSIMGEPEFKLIEGLSNLYSKVGFYHRAFSMLEKAKVKTQEEELRKWLVEAYLLLDMNQLDKVKQLVKKIERDGVYEIRSPDLYVVYQNIMGLYYLNTNKPHIALEYFNRGLKTALKKRITRQLFSLAANKATALASLERLDEALTTYRFILKKIRHSDESVWNRVGVYINMANIYLWKKEIDTSIAYYQKASLIALRHRLYYPYLLAELNLIYVLLIKGDYERILRELRKVERYLAVINYKWAQARSLALHGEALAFLGDKKRSRKYLKDALGIFLDNNMLHDAGAVFSFLLAFALVEKDFEEVVEIRKKIEKYPYLRKGFLKFFEYFDNHRFENINELANRLKNVVAKRFVLANVT